MMHICIFEDEKYLKLQPLVYFRPVYDLICGCTTLRDKILREFPGAGISLHARNYLLKVLSEQSSGVSINSIPTGINEVLFVNGRILASRTVAKTLGSRYPGTDVVFMKNDTIIAAWISGKNLERVKSKLDEDGISANLSGSAETRNVPEATLIDFPWDLFRNNGSSLKADFDFLTSGSPGILGKVYDGTHLLNPSAIHIGEGAKIKPGVVLDAEGGPIYIAANVKVMPNAVIEGPAFVGENSVIKVAAKIYENTTIGRTCKVGGEVEESVIHGFSNKQHEGFLGHAYLGEWVNIGADSNNSDLKNDYGNVKVYNDGVLVDTGSQFVGLTMGDHSKCGINSMFNTGTVVSVCCNIFGAGLPPKYVPAFSWGGGSDGLVTYKIEKAIEVAKRVMARRKINMSSSMEELFAKVYEMTADERRSNGVS